MEAAYCNPTVGNCAVATGRVVYVERIDPDGDGDAHLVLLGNRGITAAGVSVIDVERGLRPQPLPALGTVVSAAGPVFRGSYGQRQIQATELNLPDREPAG